jgi:hypothetical protein
MAKNLMAIYAGENNLQRKNPDLTIIIKAASV